MRDIEEPWLQSEMSEMIEELKRLGMKVNVDKTEVVVFSKNKEVTRTHVTIGDINIETKSDMKVLGVIIDNHLQWEAQVRSIVSKCRSKLSALKRIRNKFSMDQFLKILTSQYFSQLYYCALLWLNSETRWNLKRIINSAHYKGLRIAAKDFKKKQSRSLLDKECKRATPTQWGNYAVASLFIKTLKNS